jgi:glutathione peroxidase
MTIAVAKNHESSIYDFTLATIDGRQTTLDEYRGRILLIVNVASRCGFTPQYAGLEALYRKFKDQGLVVLGFPCNQFGGQEPGTESEIREFCSTQYEVTFPLFAKIDVNGKNADPLYVWLKSQAKGILGTEAIKWNFTKFLVDTEGKVIDRFGPNVTPEELDATIAELVGGP